MIITLSRFTNHPSLWGKDSTRTHLEFDTQTKDFSLCEQIGDREEFVRTPLTLLSIDRNNMGEPFREFATLNFKRVPWIDTGSFDFDFDEVKELRKHLPADIFSAEINRKSL